MPNSMENFALLGSVVDDSPVGFAVFDRELRFRYLNRSLALVLGRSVADCTGRRITELFHSPAAQESHAAIERILRTGEAEHDLELTVANEDPPRILVLNRYPIRNARGTIVAAGVNVQDVTERRRLAELEQEAEHLRRVAEMVTAQRASEAEAHQARLDAARAEAQMMAERQVLRLFQQAMLPDGVPEVPGAELAVAYRPVSPEMDIGGDWYDAFALPDGRLVLSVGDISGHDMHAAAVVGQVRHTIRAYAMLDPQPGPVLRQTNALLLHRPDLTLVSMLYGVYDPASRRLCWGSAGHPPPLLRHGTDVAVLTRPQLPILGAVPRDEPYAEYDLVLAPGDVLVWYTDGLIERRDTDLPESIKRLAGLVRDAGTSDADGLVAHLLADCLSDGAQDDDVCLLVLRIPS